MKKVKNRWPSAFEQRLVASSKVQLIFLLMFNLSQPKAQVLLASLFLMSYDINSPWAQGWLLVKAKMAAAYPVYHLFIYIFFLIKIFHLCLSQGYIEHRDCSLYFGMDYRRATRPIL